MDPKPDARMKEVTDRYPRSLASRRKRFEPGSCSGLSLLSRRAENKLCVRSESGSCRRRTGGKDHAMTLETTQPIQDN